MKKVKGWAVLVAMAGSTLFAVSCATQLRDAATAGALDFITGTTTDTLSAVITLEDPVSGDEE